MNMNVTMMMMMNMVAVVIAEAVGAMVVVGDVVAVVHENFRVCFRFNH